MPDFNVPHVFDSVTGIMADYESQARSMSAQGKSATAYHSGSYGMVDTVLREWQKRWPN